MTMKKAVQYLGTGVDLNNEIAEKNINKSDS
jgi:hypothetical protein